MKLPITIKKPLQRSEAEIYLDANESPFNTLYNRYPDEEELGKLKQTWGKHERIPEACIYFTNGTEEAVDMCMRLFCLPVNDNVASVAPTRSVYERRALVNRLEYREVRLNDEDYSLNAEDLLNVVSPSTTMLLLCSPNCPTGNLLDRKELEHVLQHFEGMVVVDESYIDFTPQDTVVGLLNEYSNLVVLRSFSHAWSAASFRLAAIVAHPDVIEAFEKIGYTHPLSGLVIEQAQQAVNKRLDVDKWVRRIVDERTKVSIALKQLSQCEKVYPSCTNFLWVKFKDCAAVSRYLEEQGIAVRAEGDYIRITIGLPGENSALLSALRKQERLLKP